MWNSVKYRSEDAAQDQGKLNQRLESIKEENTPNSINEPSHVELIFSPLMHAMVVAWWRLGSDTQQLTFIAFS